MLPLIRGTLRGAVRGGFTIELKYDALNEPGLRHNALNLAVTLLPAPLDVTD